jgi:predicted negative regulator of RcsB-dependent stress response
MRHDVNELHTEDSQAMLVKLWWAKYGTIVIAGVILAIVGLSGYRYWTARQAEYTAKASLLYDQYQLAMNTHNDEILKATYNTLKKDYKRTPYATAVTLIESARNVQDNKLDEATAALAWVIDQGNDYAKPLARLRLAEIKVQQKEYGAAEELLKHPTDKAYEAPYQEMTGDIYFAQGKINEALAEYTKALQGYRDQGFENILLQYKLQTFAPNKPAGGQ